MDELNQNQAPQQEGGRKGVGGTIAIIIIIIVVVIGALYLLGKTSVSEGEPINIPPLGTTDDLDTLEKDLGNTPDLEAAAIEGLNF